MTFLASINDTILTPTFATVLPAKLDSPNARRELLAIGLQESRFLARRQRGGPAVSFWQFEVNGIRAVMTHPASAAFAEAACKVLNVPFDARAIYNAMPTNDKLGCVFARLLLFTDPAPLPADKRAGWRYYTRNWRPGAPRPETWDDNWAEACQVIPL